MEYYIWNGTQYRYVKISPIKKAKNSFRFIYAKNHFGSVAINPIKFNQIANTKFEKKSPKNNF